MKRRILWGIVVLVVLLAGYAGAHMTARPAAWRDGDLIFQTSHSNQSAAIGLASRSLFTHMGILEKRNEGWVVLEAAGPVRATPLYDWIRRGRLGRYAVYRRPLDEAQTNAILHEAHTLMGRPYDLFFDFDNKAIDCSELAWLAYGAAGIAPGKVQTVSQLHVGKGARKLIRARWRRDPDCAGLDAEACYARVMKRRLVTPVAIAHDPDFRQIYSNYPF